MPTSIETTSWGFGARSSTMAVEIAGRADAPLTMAACSTRAAASSEAISAARPRA
jgi:hypothetical protein